MVSPPPPPATGLKILSTSLRALDSLPCSFLELRGTRSSFPSPACLPGLLYNTIHLLPLGAPGKPQPRAPGFSLQVRDSRGNRRLLPSAGWGEGGRRVVQWAASARRRAQAGSHPRPRETAPPPPPPRLPFQSELGGQGRRGPARRSPPRSLSRARAGGRGRVRI